MENKDKLMITRDSWENFRAVGLLWFINQTLHLFGWAIVTNVDENGKVTECYPARCKFRGFSENHNEEGYIKLTNHLKENIDQLVEDCKDE